MIDLANIMVCEKHQRKGIFKSTLSTLQELNPWDGIHVENIHNPIIWDYLFRLQKKDPRWVNDDFNFNWINRKDSAC